MNLTAVIRLVDSGGDLAAWSGMVQIFYDGEWGTICNNNFGSKEASVACRQLGLRYEKLITLTSNINGRELSL